MNNTIDWRNQRDASLDTIIYLAPGFSDFQRPSYTGRGGGGKDRPGSPQSLAGLAPVMLPSSYFGGDGKGAPMQVYKCTQELSRMLTALALALGEMPLSIKCVENLLAPSAPATADPFSQLNRLIPN